MSSEAFLSLYLKEVGVTAPASSFLCVAEEKQAVPVVAYAASAALDPVVEVAEPEPVIAIADDPVAQDEVIKDKESAQKTRPSLDAIGDLSALEKQCLGCEQCGLAASRNHVVFGAGEVKADLVFIGDAPDRDEDVAGKPFAGRSGLLFERMLAGIALKREDVYVMNAVKCRPLHSRDPKPDEFAACEHWLATQLQLLQPKLICVLGRVAAQSLLQTDDALQALRGKQHTFRGIPVVVVDHPSYLLRSQQHKSRAWQDFLALQERYLLLTQ